MLKIIKENSGVYLLEIFASVPFQIDLEKYKDKVFPQGYYYYAGIGQKNLQQKVERHTDQSKSTQWHIDYITNISTNKPKSIFLFDSTKKNLECQLIRDLIDNFRLRIIARGFGNSSCNRCETHLLYCKQRLTHSHFTAQYQSIVRVMPASSETA